MITEKVLTHRPQNEDDSGCFPWYELLGKTHPEKKKKGRPCGRPAKFHDKGGEGS